MVSVLRHKHRVCVLVCPLGHGGYVNHQQNCGGEEGGEGGRECDEYQQVDQSTAGVTEPLPASV